MLGVVRLFVELASTLLIAGAVVAALWGLRRGADLRQMRLTLADGLLLALNFQVAATLLRTAELTSWDQIGFFVAVFALRTLLKRALTREREHLRAGWEAGQATEQG